MFAGEGEEDGVGIEYVVGGDDEREAGERGKVQEVDIEYILEV